MRSVSLAPSLAVAVVNDNAARPEPAAFELLIRVCAAGVITTEVAWYPTSHRKNGEIRTGAVLGHEFSGVVEAVGEGVGDLEVGREVFGMNDWFSDGALADYCTAPYYAVAPKPSRLTISKRRRCRSALSPPGKVSSIARNCSPASVFWCMAARERWEPSPSNSRASVART